ncbi:MAG: molybdenum cofactor guanylyltransferase [Pirellulaceae bacterium]|nr:molybdenum cofactor guanylyltransferase [Pirellulaceae bacterium]MDP7016813.1 molybdenum cofactor guanylyltransferase [Pirellulaceae bacterium]
MSRGAENLGGIVLCGGASRRMGLSKADLPFGDETMLQRVVRLLGEVASPVAVVAAADQSLPPLPDDVLVARDDKPDRGPLEGLAAGLATLQSRAAVAYATSCDAPLLQPAFIEALRERLAPDDDAVVAVDGKFHHPLAAIYRVSVLAEVRALLDADQLRPFFLFDRCRTSRVEIDDLRSADAQLLTLKNVNEPDDYFQALRRAGLECPDEIRAQFDRRDH